MTVLWVVVIVMALALVAEIFALIGLLLVAQRTARHLQTTKDDLAQAVARSVRVLQQLNQSLHPHTETVRRDGAEIAALLTARGQSLKAVFADTDQRFQRLRVRYRTEGMHAVEQLQSGRRVIQNTGRVLSAVSAALWLLRKVA